MSTICSVCGAPRDAGARFCPACGSHFTEEVDAWDGFISYRREGGRHVAPLLKLLLETGFGKRFFLDVDELQVGRFDEKLLDRIGNSPNFMLILSLGCLDRCAEKNDWLKREIMHALETRRNIIPVLVDGFEFPDQGRMDLLPEAMRILPNFQAVVYSDVYRESAVRKIARYCVDSIPIAENVGIPTQHQSESDFQWLLGARVEIEKLNQYAVADTETSLDQQSGTALPIALLCVVEQWNKSQLMVERDGLKKQVEAINGFPITPNSWTAVLRCLTVRSPTETQMRTLLLTPKTDHFAIHYPRLDELWNSSLGTAIQTTFGVTQKLRTPVDPAEVQWVEWMRCLETSLSSARQTASAQPRLSAAVGEVYSAADRAQIEAGMEALQKLPVPLRPAVAQHLGKLISEKRHALVSIRDEPGNSDAYAYIGTLFYWDLMRIAISGTEDERQLARDEQWTPSDSNPVRGYSHISLYFLRHYLAINPNGQMREDAKKVIAILEGITEDAKKLAKERSNE
jgi:hypothetical protein